ncbi:MAG: hypothetical protein FWE50_00965 [Alphaproteobacteria bacterium]|nr:hypothetical protein [Alphaproteobacteria bacterium]
MNNSGYDALRKKYGIGNSSTDTKPAQKQTVEKQTVVAPEPGAKPVTPPVMPRPVEVQKPIIPTYEKPKPQAPVPVKPQLPSQLKLFKKLKEDAEIDDECEFLEKLLEKVELLNESDAKTMMRDSFNDNDEGEFSFDYNGYNFNIKYSSEDDLYTITLSNDDLSEEVEQEFKYDPKSETPALLKVLEQRYIESLNDGAKKDFEIMQNVEKNLGTKIKHYYSESINYGENGGEYYLKTESKQNKYICVKDTQDENEDIADFNSMDVSFTNIDPAIDGFDISDCAHHTIEINNYEVPYWRIAKKIIDYIGNEYDKDSNAAATSHNQLLETRNKPADVRQKIVLDGIRQM